MHYSIIKTTKTITTAAAIAAATILSCGDNNYYYYPNPTTPDSTSRTRAPDTARTGAVNIHATLAAANPGLRKTAAIKPTKIVVEISADDIQTIRFSRPADFSYPTVLDTTISVEPGTERRVKVWAEDTQGRQTHADDEGYQTVNVSADQPAAVYVNLAPSAGSIYIMVSNLAPTLFPDSLKAGFTAAGGTVVASAGTKLTRSPGSDSYSGSVSLEFIPHGATGTIYAEIRKTIGGIYASAQKTITFDARGDNGIVLVFRKSNETFSLEVEMHPNGVSNAAYDFSAADTSLDETGELVITEILYNAATYNYVELYNPANTPATFDTLIVSTKIAGAKVPNVTVPAKGYFVIGDESTVSFANRIAPLTVSVDACNLTIRRKDRTVIDRVAYTGDPGNTLDWPAAASPYGSIELKPGRYTAAENNYGRNWTASQTKHPLTAVGFGTPGEGYGE